MTTKTWTRSPMTCHEYAAWRDGYLIAWVGASNPRGVSFRLATHESELGPDHVAVRAIRGHLAFLQGEALGPDMDDLTAVRDFGRDVLRYTDLA